MGSEEGGEPQSALHCSTACNTPGIVAGVLPAVPVVVLPSQASQSGHTIVVYEVALSVLRLVRHYASSLEDREWEVVFRILHSTQHHLTQAQQVQHREANLQCRGSRLLSVRLSKTPHHLDSYRQHCKTSSLVLSCTGREARTTLVQLTSSSNFWTISETHYQLDSVVSISSSHEALLPVSPGAVSPKSSPLHSSCH